MLGKTGGAPVRIVAEVREATAETGVLYGAEFTGGTDTALLEPAAQRQVAMAREILGLRQSAEKTGALLELGWTGLETKAAWARLMFWWRLGRTESELMRRLEAQAHDSDNVRTTGGNASHYNWWRHTDALVAGLAQRAGRTPEALRALPRAQFRHVIGHLLWKQEYHERLEACKHSVRLEIPLAELTQLAASDAQSNKERTRWPGAPYLGHIDSKHHARLLAMARLGLLPVEIEEGRWHGIPREERKCKFGCCTIGDLAHFLRECTVLSSDRIPALDSHGAEKAAADHSLSPFFFWRRTARALECRWRERTKKLRATAKEPQHPADGQDHAVAGEVDTIAERQPATHDNPSCLSVAPPGSRAQQGSAKTIAKRRKKPK